MALLFAGSLLIAACSSDKAPGNGAGGTSGAAQAGGSAGTLAGSGGSGGSAGAASLCGPPNTMGAALPTLIANPIISRGKPAFGSVGAAAVINDGKYKVSAWVAPNLDTAGPAWVAIQVGAGAERVLLSWTASNNYNYTDIQYGAPLDYQVETSADSTNGSDGAWTSVASVTGNTVRTRAHSFDFTGQSWVRFTVSAAPAAAANATVAIDEIDVHDISNGSEDTWFFLGDSITAFAYDRALADSPTFADNVHAAHATYYPAMINGGIGGEHSAEGLARIDTVLDLNPDYHFFAITYGTNDVAGNQRSTTAFKTNMQGIIDKIVAKSAVPVLSHIPFSTDGTHNTVALFNQAIDELIQTNALPAGPDLCTWFEAHPTELQDDKLHPLPEGRISMNKLWSDAMDGAYTP